MRIRWSERARQDRLDIVGYIAKYDPDAADKVDDLLLSAAESLLVFPRKGHPGRISGIRELFVSPWYYLLYTINSDIIYIVSVWHTSKQFPKFNIFNHPE